MPASIINKEATAPSMATPASTVADVDAHAIHGADNAAINAV
jgi:hypothetical protein